MARMYPPEIKEDTESWAEREMFEVIRHGLSDEWAVCHSLGLAFHPSKPWAEIDFVLIGPQGFFSLEVKGGIVTRTDGVWRFGKTEKREGPWDQVGSARAALHNHLAGRLPWLREVISGYGVAMPDFTFTQTGPDIEPRVLYDERDLGKPFSAFVRRLSDYWTERLEAQLRRPVQLLTEGQRRELLEAIRGDFDLRPSLATRVGIVDKELLRLTEEQYRRLDELAANERVVVRGGAGSGKTLLAVEETRRASREMREQTGSPGKEGRILFCCHSERLAQYVGAALRDRSNVDVRSLYRLMTDAVRRAGMGERLPKVEQADLMEVFLPEATVEALMDLGEFERYKMLIVDEAQDLMREAYLDVLDSLLAGGLNNGQWRVFLDPYQDVFGGIDAKGLQRLKQAHPVQLKLSVNCRNTKPVGVAYGLLSGVIPEEMLRAAGPEVEHYWYHNTAEAVKLTAECVRKLLNEGIEAKDIAVLAPMERERTWLRNGFPAGTPGVLVDMEDPSVTPGANRIRFATVGAFKGLEAEAVLLINCEDLDEPETARAIYVGGSRAKAYLALFLPEKERPAYERRAANYGRELRERRSGAAH